MSNILPRNQKNVKLDDRQQDGGEERFREALEAVLKERILDKVCAEVETHLRKAIAVSLLLSACTSWNNLKE